MPESLEGCVGTASCPTFEYGPLSSTKMFELESIEVSRRVRHIYEILWVCD